MAEQKTDNIGLYQLCLTAGTGKPGAPTLQLQLLVNAATGRITGQGVQTQAIAPPGNQINISNITGVMHSAGFGGITKLIALRGQAFISFPPPAIGSYIAPFEAAFATDNNFAGHGGWHLGTTVVGDAPVKKCK
jgi:hypothetical protein